MASIRTNIWNVVLSLAVYKEGKLHPCGTAFLVGRSLALTASHVVDNPLDRPFHSTRDRVDPEYGMVAIQQVNGFHQALCWRIVSAHSFPAPSADEEALFLNTSTIN